MGNSHDSLQECGRRHSLVPEEFLFPESRLEPDQDWEVFHVHIELKPLPAHVRDSIHVCVDDYTQEILSWAEECVCACGSSSAAGRTWCSNSQMIWESGCDRPRSERRDPGFCWQWDVNTDLPCALNAHPPRTDTRHPDNITNGKSVHSEEGLDVNLREESRLQDSVSSDDPCDEDAAAAAAAAEANLPHEVLVTDPVLQSERETYKEMTEPKDILKSRWKTGEMNSSRSIESRCMRDGEAVSPRLWRKGKMSVNEGRSRANTLTSETSSDQEQVLRNISDTFPRRQSCSIPILRDRTTASPPHFKSPQNSPKRKFSLKDDPGWIPNPLDSDSDGSDLEDSGIFSDYSGSPRTSASPADYVVPATARAAAKERALSRERRRYNSEPTQRTSPLSSSPTQREAQPTSVASPESASKTKPAASTAAAAAVSSPRRGSRWRLLRLYGKARQPQKADDDEGDPADQAEDSLQDEDDLSEQLKWLAMSDCQISQEADSSPQPGNTDFSFPHPQPQPSPPTNAHRRDDTQSEDRREDTQGPSSSSQQGEDGAEEASRRRSSNFDGELELDWLCEPEWNNLELELFWSVLRPHLEHLLEPEDSELLPEACRVVGRLDAADPKMLDKCLLHVQWHIWKGSYCQAVADFRAIRRHFLCCAQSQLIETGTRNDVENLRLIFQRKRPSRFRLWI